MGKSRGSRLPMFFLYMSILAIMAGCAPHFRAHPQVQEKVTSIKTVAIMPPNIKVYRGVGADARLMDEETAAARHAVAAAIEKELGRHAGVVFKPFPSPSAIPAAGNGLTAAGFKDELEDTQALFERVNASILVHTYGSVAMGSRFEEKLENFDYSLGPEVQRLAKLANADALLFISGGDFRYSGGHKALTGLIALAFFLPTAGRSTTFLADLAGPTFFSVALVDGTTGALLWYNTTIEKSRLTNSNSVTLTLWWLFHDFPLGTSPAHDVYDPSGQPTGMGPD